MCITGHRTDNIKDVVSSVIDTYNNSSHRTLNNKTPNQVFKDNDDLIARHLNDSLHNQQIYKSVPLNDGDKVRILENKYMYYVKNTMAHNKIISPELLLFFWSEFINFRSVIY